MGRYSEDSEWEAGGEMRPTKVSSKEQKVMKEADDASAGDDTDSGSGDGTEASRAIKQVPGQCKRGTSASSGKPGHKKVGRPISFVGDINDPNLTATDRRRIKRRIANRESARRVRQKRQDTISEMQEQVIQLQQSNAELLGQLSMAEQGRRIMVSKINTLRDKCEQATAENSSLQREVTAAHAAIAMIGAQTPQGQQQASSAPAATLAPDVSQAPNQEHAAAIAGILQISSSGITSACPRLPSLPSMGRSLEANDDDEGLAAGCNGRLRDAGAFNSSSQMTAVRSLQQLLDALTPQFPANAPHSVPVAVPLDVDSIKGRVRTFGVSQNEQLRGHQHVPTGSAPPEQRPPTHINSLHRALDSWFLSRPASTNVLSEIMTTLPERSSPQG